MPARGGWYVKVLTAVVKEDYKTSWKCFSLPKETSMWKDGSRAISDWCFLAAFIWCQVVQNLSKSPNLSEKIEKLRYVTKKAESN